MGWVSYAVQEALYPSNVVDEPLFAQHVSGDNDAVLGKCPRHAHGAQDRRLVGRKHKLLVKESVVQIQLVDAGMQQSWMLKHLLVEPAS